MLCVGNRQIRLFMFVHKKSWKLTYKTGFSVHNIYLYLWGQVENTKLILSSRKIGVKCAYLRFLVHKRYYIITPNLKGLLLDLSL